MQINNLRNQTLDRLNRIEVELQDVSGYPALQKALEVDSFALYQTLLIDRDLIEGMEQLIHELKRDDIQIRSRSGGWLNGTNLIKLLELYHREVTFMKENEELLHQKGNLEYKRQYAMMLLDIKNFEEGWRKE